MINSIWEYRVMIPESNHIDNTTQFLFKHNLHSDKRKIKGNIEIHNHQNNTILPDATKPIIHKNYKKSPNSPSSKTMRIKCMNKNSCNNHFDIKCKLDLSLEPEPIESIYNMHKQNCNFYSYEDIAKDNGDVQDCYCTCQTIQHSNFIQDTEKLINYENKKHLLREYKIYSRNNEEKMNHMNINSLKDIDGMKATFYKINNNSSDEKVYDNNKTIEKNKRNCLYTSKSQNIGNFYYFDPHLSAKSMPQPQFRPKIILKNQNQDGVSFHVTESKRFSSIKNQINEKDTFDPTRYHESLKYNNYYFQSNCLSDYKNTNIHVFQDLSIDQGMNTHPNAIHNEYERNGKEIKKKSIYAPKTYHSGTFYYFNPILAAQGVPQPQFRPKKK